MDRRAWGRFIEEANVPRVRTGGWGGYLEGTWRLHEGYMDRLLAGFMRWFALRVGSVAGSVCVLSLPSDGSLGMGGYVLSSARSNMRGEKCTV